MKKLFLSSYFLFLLLVAAYSYVFVDPGLIYLRFIFTDFFQTNRAITTFLFVSMIFIFFAYYAGFLYFVKKKILTVKEIRNSILASAGILLFAYPAMLSFDIFNYIATAKVTFFYHENPYIIMPIEFLHDPLLLFMHAANKTALYAPFWILLTGIPFILGFHNFLVTLFFFKLFTTLLYLATAFLLWHMTKSITKTIFFALNPLVLIEILISGHNDISMMLLFLVSCYFILNKQNAKTWLFFFLSAMIKYATLIVTPLFIWQTFKPLTRERFFLFASIGMYIIFFLSTFRVEIYPWYALWFLLPVSFLAGDNLITWISTTFSFSLLLRYIPFMLIGTYFGPTPLLNTLLTFIPVVIVIGIYVYAHTYVFLKRAKN